MSELKHQILQQLPYLRRYARALTGSLLFSSPGRAVRPAL
jgi:hypothetical protein